MGPRLAVLGLLALSLLPGCATVPGDGPGVGLLGVRRGAGGPGAELFNAAKTGDLATLRAQLANQDANAAGRLCPTNQSGTAIMAAAEAGNTQAVRLLLAAGADPNRQVRKVMQWPCNHYTALIFAAKAGHTDIVKLLLAGGADPSLRGGRLSGRTAAEWARHEGRADIADLIASAEAMSPEQRREKFAVPAPAGFSTAAAPEPAPAPAPAAASAVEPAPAPSSQAVPAPAPAPAPAPKAEPRRELTPAERKALDSQL